MVFVVKSPESVKGREFLASVTDVTHKMNYNHRVSVNAIHFICCSVALRFRIRHLVPRSKHFSVIITKAAFRAKKSSARLPSEGK